MTTQKLIRRLAILTFSALLCLGIAACSDDDDPTSPVGPPPPPELIFSDGFEAVTIDATWHYDEDNWRGTKQITATDPNEGSQCLFMKGSDDSPGTGGGCSYMVTKQAFDEAEVRITLWFKNFRSVEGSGGDGRFTIDLWDSAGNSIGIVHEEPGREDGYMYYVARSLGGQSYRSSVMLRNLSGWAKLEVFYTAGPEGSIVVELDDDTVLDTGSIGTLPNFGKLQLGVGGQYMNTGEVYIDGLEIHRPGS